MRAQFDKERTALEAVQDSRIVKLIDSFELERHYLLVMQCVEGTTLSQVMQQRQCHAWLQNHRDVVRFILEIAKALWSLHQAGWIHRDISPANIMVTRQRTPILIDFGLACHDKDYGHGGSERVGTRPYMRPEEIDRGSKRPDSRTDVYSLAVIMYELLTGKEAYVAEVKTELMEVIQSGTFRPIRQLNARIPKRLAKLCAMAMSTDLKERPDAFEFTEQLQAYLFLRRRLIYCGGMLAMISLSTFRYRDFFRTTLPGPEKVDSYELKLSKFEIHVRSFTGQFTNFKSGSQLSSGDQIRFDIGFNCPAFIQLYWISGLGNIHMLVPNAQEARDFPTARISAPIDEHSGIGPLEPTGSSEIALLIANRRILTQPAVKESHVRLESKGNFPLANQFMAGRKIPLHSGGPGNFSVESDGATPEFNDPIIHMMHELRDKYDIIYAARLPTKSFLAFD